MDQAHPAPPRRELGKLQFSLIDLALWMAYLAVAAAVWKPLPVLSVLMLLWGVPGALRDQAYRRTQGELHWLERGLIFVMCVLLEAGLSLGAMCLAAMTCLMVTIFLTLIGVVLQEVVLSNDILLLLAGVGAFMLLVTAIGAYIFFYENMRRDSWPTAQPKGPPRPSEEESSLSLYARQVRAKREREA